MISAGLLSLATVVPVSGESTTPTEFSPAPHAATLAAWREARFGLFLHWGLYSLAEGRWKGSWVATEEPWKGKGFTEFMQLQARIPIKEYERFARGFRPEAFDAEAWVRDAKAAGMRYLVITTKHHEGFAMYRSPSNSFNLVDHAGYGRDPVADLAEACRRHGLLFGVYYSLGRDWHDPDAPTDWPSKGGRSNTWDYPDEDGKVFERYFRRKVLPQTRELLTQYGAIDLFWFDTPEGITREQSEELKKLIRELQPACVVNDRVGRHGSGLGDFQTYEQKVPPVPVRTPWETCATLGKNWSFHPRDNSWKTPEQIVRLLTDVVAKDGNLLFNIGPRGDGSWPEGAAAHLKTVGDWLAVNGAAIHGARAWTAHAEGPEGDPDGEPGPIETGSTATQDTVKNEISQATMPDLRFTLGKDGALFVIARSWTSETVKVRMLGLGRPEAPRIFSARLLGSDEKVRWKQTEDGLELNFPADRPSEVPVWVFRLETTR